MLFTGADCPAKPVQEKENVLHSDAYFQYEYDAFHYGSNNENIEVEKLLSFSNDSFDTGFRPVSLYV